MAPRTVKTKGLLDGEVGMPLALRVTGANVAAVALGAATLGMYHRAFVPGFLLGSSIALVNIFWLMLVIRKGMVLPAEAAAKSVARSYYVRFAATVAILTLIISKGLARPLPVLLGLTASIFTTVVVMAFTALLEVSQDA